MKKAKQDEGDEGQSEKFLQGHDNMHKSRRPDIPEAEIQAQREVIKADGDHENGEEQQTPAGEDDTPEGIGRTERQTERERQPAQGA